MARNKILLNKFPVGTSTNDIPNIITRLFNTKFTELLNDIINNEFFGKIWAYVYTIEFQKRGLPHARLILTLHPLYKLFKTEDIDKYISAEIPSHSIEVFFHQKCQIQYTISRNQK